MSTADPHKKNLGSPLKSAFRSLSGRTARAEQSKAHAANLKQMYENFREILNLNDATLQLIADIEDRLSGRVPFSLNMVIHRVRRGVMDSFSMVKYLNQITDGRYGELYDAVRRVNAEIETEYAGRRGPAGGPVGAQLL